MKTINILDTLLQSVQTEENIIVTIPYGIVDILEEGHNQYPHKEFAWYMTTENTVTENEVEIRCNGNYFIPMQKATLATCNSLGEGDEVVYQNVTKNYMQCHSHVSMGVGSSAQDEKENKEQTIDLAPGEYHVALIINKDTNVSIRVYKHILLKGKSIALEIPSNKITIELSETEMHRLDQNGNEFIEETKWNGDSRYQDWGRDV